MRPNYRIGRHSAGDFLFATGETFPVVDTMGAAVSRVQPSKDPICRTPIVGMAIEGTVLLGLVTELRCGWAWGRFFGSVLGPILDAVMFFTQ